MMDDANGGSPIRAEPTQLMKEIALSPTGAALATTIADKLGMGHPSAADAWAASVCDHARALLEMTAKAGRL